MFARWRNTAVAIGAVCFPYTFAAGSSNAYTIPATMVACVVQAGSPGLVGWYNSVQECLRGLTGPSPSIEADAPDEAATLTELTENEVLPELPPIRVPSSPWLYFEDLQAGPLVVDGPTRGDDRRCNDSSCPCHETVILGPPSESDDSEQDGQSERLKEPATQILFQGSIESLDEDPATADNADRPDSEVEAAAGAGSDSDESDSEAEVCPDEPESEKPEASDSDLFQEEGAIDGIFSPFECPIDWARREAIWI